MPPPRPRIGFKELFLPWFKESLRLALCSVWSFLLIMGFLCCAANAQAHHKRVLLLVSYHQGDRWTDQIIKGFSEGIQKRQPTGLFVEFLDDRRKKPRETAELMRDYLHRKYRDTPFDIVACSDDPAFDFLLAHRAFLFPGVPMVFCGVNDYTPARLNGQTDITGVNEAPDIQGTIDLILKLQPEIKTLAVVGADTQSTYQSNLSRFYRAKAAFNNRLESREYVNLKEDQAQTIMAELPRDAVVLVLGPLFRGNEEEIPPVESCRVIAQSAPVPTWGLWDFQLGAGILGGRLVSGLNQGHAVASLANRILAGEPADTIPVLDSPNQPIIDWKELIRLNLDPARIPAGATIINRPFSLWEQYLPWIFSAAGTIVFQAFWVIMLLVSRHRRKQTECELRRSKEQHQAILENAPIGIFQCTSGGRYIAANPKHAAILGYEGPTDLIRSVKDIAQDVYVDPSDWDAVVKHLMKQGYIENHEVQRKRKDGSLFWGALHARLSKSGLGEDVFDGFLIDTTARKQAEEERKQSEGQFRCAFDYSAIGKALVATDGRFLKVNIALCKMLGYPREELLAKTFQDITHPDDLDTDLAFVRKVLAAEIDTYQMEKRYFHKQGGVIWALLSVALVRNNVGQPRFFISQIMDISARKKAEQVLRESEERYRIVADFTSHWEYWLAPDGRFLYVSPSCERITGYRHQEFLQNPDLFLAIIHPDDRQNLAAHLKQRADTTEKSDSLEFRIITQTGEVRWVGHTCQPVLDGDGQYLGHRGSNRDITGRKQAELTLRESEERYRFLVEISSEAMLLRNSKGEIVYANPAALRLFHASKAEDLLGKDYLSFVHPDDREESARRVHRCCIENSAVPWREHRLIAVDGQEVHAKSTGFPVNYSGQQHVLGLYHDLTERKRAEDNHQKVEVQLRQAQKMEAVGRLAGGIAHDFNNMLGVIMGFTGLAIEKLAPDDPVRSNLEEVSIAATRSAELTRQLLAFARKQTIAPKVLDLNKTIADMLSMLRRLIGEDIDLLWNPGKDLWPVKMDPSQIDQILANLAVNARDAIAGVGKITIETENEEFDAEYCKFHTGCTPGEYVMLAVSDDGCGMDKEILGNIFEPFFTTKKMGEGTGLGLATIYGIVKQNNGFIYVYSEPGQGTTFKIYLPRPEPQEAAIDQERQAAGVPTGKEVVLLVEDEKSLLKFSRILLEELGYTVLAASSPREALQLAKEYTNAIHLLITDVVMPGMSGRELWEQLNTLRPGLKSLFMSGYTTNVIAHHGVLEEGFHFIQKPFSKQALATKIRKTLS